MTRLIKKYKNRRLYDLEISKYITVDDLKQYVLDNIVFQVIDVADDKDITMVVLLQIVVEMNAGNTPFLTTDMLRQLIVMANHPMNQISKTMFEKIMKPWG